MLCDVARSESVIWVHRIEHRSAIYKEKLRSGVASAGACHFGQALCNSGEIRLTLESSRGELEETQTLYL